MEECERATEMHRNLQIHTQKRIYNMLHGDHHAVVVTSDTTIFSIVLTWRTSSSDNGETDGQQIGTGDAAACPATATDDDETELRAGALLVPTTECSLWRRADDGECNERSWNGWRHGPQSDTLSTASPRISSTRQKSSCSTNVSNSRTTGPAPEYQ